MIPYFEGQARSSLLLEAGDVLCLAGCDPTQRIPFEHVGFVPEQHDITAAEQLCEVVYYGVPESIEKGDDPKGATFVLRRGTEFLSHEKVVLGVIGSPTTVWNLIGRADEMTEAKAMYLPSMLAHLEGRIEVRYDKKFVVVDLKRQLEEQQALPKIVVETNCLGWVCSALTLCEVSVLSSRRFPLYDSPYQWYPGQRDYPSPGHFFRAVNRGRDVAAYCPETPEEARKFALAAQTLHDLRIHL